MASFLSIIQHDPILRSCLMLDMIAKFGHRSLDSIQTLGNSGRFLFRVLVRKPDLSRLLPDLMTQL